MGAVDISFTAYLLISLIPIGFQIAVMFYLKRVWKYIGFKSAFIMLLMSVIGLAYDFIVTGAILLRVGLQNDITYVGLFIGFAFPIMRSGLMLWLMQIMAKGLAYKGKKATKPQGDS